MSLPVFVQSFVMAAKKTPSQSAPDSAESISHDSPEVVRRMDRIEDNFARFDELMSEVESKLPPEENVKPRKPK